MSSAVWLELSASRELFSVVSVANFLHLAVKSGFPQSLSKHIACRVHDVRLRDVQTQMHSAAVQLRPSVPDPSKQGKGKGGGCESQKTHNNILNIVRAHSMVTTDAQRVNAVWQRAATGDMCRAAARRRTTMII